MRNLARRLILETRWWDEIRMLGIALIVAGISSPVLFHAALWQAILLIVLGLVILFICRACAGEQGPYPPDESH